MAKLPLTSNKSNLACLYITAWLNNLSSTRKCFWHLLFSESRQQPEQFGLCLPYLRTQDYSLMRACVGPVSQHTICLASLPPEEDMVTREHPPLPPAPRWLHGWLPSAWKRAASSCFPDGGRLSWGQRLGQKWFLSPHVSKTAAGS